MNRAPKEAAMKSSIALFSLFALTVIAVGAGLEPANTTPTPARALAAVPAIAAPAAPTTPASKRYLPMKVMPTITVVASSADLDLDRAEQSAGFERSVMLDAAVDSAGDALVQPLRASLPRARLGNPFYDFGRSNSVPVVAE
jgi:hypothetical protein